MSDVALLAWASLCLASTSCTRPSDGLLVQFPLRDTVFYRELAPNDTVFADPYLIERWGDNIVVADGLDQRLVILDTIGTFLGTIGRKGEGPTEFRFIRDVVIQEDGSLLVVDARNQRISKVDRDGIIASTWQLDPTLGRPWSAAAVDHLFVVAFAPRPLIGYYSSDWTLLDTVRLTWQGSALGDSIIGTSRVAAATGRSGRWSSAFSFGPGFVLWDDHSSRSYPYLGSKVFTRSGEPIRDYGAFAVAVTIDEIYLLDGGTPARGEVERKLSRGIDVYGWDGQYRRTYTFAGRITDFAVAGRTIYLLQREPHIAVLAMRDPLPPNPGAPF